jgi:hypothetical protein
LLHRLAEVTSPCQLDQINADPKGNLDRLARKKLISKLYMEQSVKIRLDQGLKRSVKIGRGVRKVAVCRRFCSTCTASTLPRKLLKGLETSK